MPPSLLDETQRSAIAITGTGVVQRSIPTCYDSVRLTLYVSCKVVEYINPETRIVRQGGRRVSHSMAEKYEPCMTLL